MAIDLQGAIAVFDKSANAQTEAWAVIRAELMRVMDAPVGTALIDAHPWPTIDDIDADEGQRFRLVPVEEPTNGD